jgi:hypothetical protein
LKLNTKNYQFSKVHSNFLQVFTLNSFANISEIMGFVPNHPLAKPPHLPLANVNVCQKVTDVHRVSSTMLIPLERLEVELPNWEVLARP